MAYVCKKRGGKSRMAMCMSGDIPFQQHKQNVEHHLTFLTQKRNPRKKPCIFHFALTKFFFPVFFFGSSRGGSEGWSMTTGVRSSSAQKKKEGGWLCSIEGKELGLFLSFFSHEKTKKGMREQGTKTRLNWPRLTESQLLREREGKSVVLFLVSCESFRWVDFCVAWHKVRAKKYDLLRLTIS